MLKSGVTQALEECHRIAIIAMLAALAVPQAQSQMPDRTGLPGVMVTARKLKEPLEKTPLAVSIATGEELQSLGIADTRTLGKLVPGFAAADSGFDTPIFTLRGVGYDDQSYTATSPVAIYTDEISLPYPIMSSGSNLDLQRVEVLKGPQGTLYGRNSTGGAINYVSNTPTPRFVGGFSAGLSRFATEQVEGYLSGPLTGDLEGRIAAQSTTSQEGWQISETRNGDRLGKRNSQSGRGTLDWRPQDDLLLRLTLSGWRNYGEPQAPYAMYLDPQNATVNPHVQNYPFIPDNRNPQLADWAPYLTWRLHDNFWNVVMRSEWRLANHSSLVGLLWFDQVRSDGSQLPDSGTDVDVAEQNIHAFIHSGGAELRLSTEWSDTVRSTIGLNSNIDKAHENHKFYVTYNSFNFPLPVIGNPAGVPLISHEASYKGDNIARANALFATVDWSVLQSWSVSLGARYTKDLHDFSGCTYEATDANSTLGFTNLFNLISISRGGHGGMRKGDCLTLNPQGNGALYQSKLGEHNLATRASLDWTPLDGSLLYLSYARGYKSGGYTVIPASTDVEYAPAKQEKLLAYEVGSKWLSHGRRLRAQIAAFHYDYFDKQFLASLNDPVFGALPVLSNAPKSMVDGGELSFNWTPLYGLYLSPAVSYVRTKVIEYRGIGSSGTEQDFAGEPFDYAPRLQLTLISNYTFPVVADWLATVGGSYVYSGSTSASLDHDPRFALNAYGLVDVHTNLARPNRSWMLTAFCRNLFNTFYRTSGFITSDVIAGYAGQPRTYGVTIAYDFANR